MDDYAELLGWLNLDAKSGECGDRPERASAAIKSLQVAVAVAEQARADAVAVALAGGPHDAMALIERYQLDIQFFGAAGSPQGVWRAYQSIRCELDGDLREGWGATPEVAVIAVVAEIRRAASMATRWV